MPHHRKPGGGGQGAGVAMLYIFARSSPQRRRKILANTQPEGFCAGVEARISIMLNKHIKLPSRALVRIATLGLAGASLAGCVYYPSGYAYGGGYAPGYYAAQPVYVAPVVVGGWWGWGGGWGHGGGRGR
jgi:hypothetical protein